MNFFGGVRDYWKCPKVGGFFWWQKFVTWLKKRGWGLPLAKKHFLGKKRPTIFRPWVRFMSPVYRVGLIKILLFSLTFTQIWLNPCPLVPVHLPHKIEEENPKISH
jgi:hypothetical protein